ncbi:MAG TPA: sigma-70 family RNA polymerase sigma factor [Terracidiphilus sp.]|nr:sigma-70 family RNA polymerase sigma factor [Terracidiphilus sp.]
MSHLAQNGIPQVSTVTTFASRPSSRDFQNKEALEARALTIVTAVQSGSTSAFDELQRLYSSRLFKIILRITKNREDAEDALQDTFLRAFVALRQFQGRSSVYSWLTRIAINSALMVLRRRRARPETILPSSFFEPEDPFAQLEMRDTAPNPEQMCEIRELSDDLLCAIQKLRPQLRAPIAIRLEKELSVKELAVALNISEPAVKARLYRARALLAIKVAANHETRRRLRRRLIGKGVPLSRENQEQARQILTAQ